MQSQGMTFFYSVTLGPTLYSPGQKAWNSNELQEAITLGGV